MKKNMNMWNTITAAAITTILTMGGTALAGDGVELEFSDPYASGNWTAQATTHMNGSEIDQNDPYGNGDWTAQPTIALGGREVVAVDNNRTAGNPRIRRVRENTQQLELCNRPVIRLILQRAFNIELNCP